MERLLLVKVFVVTKISRRVLKESPLVSAKKPSLLTVRFMYRYYRSWYEMT